MTIEQLRDEAYRLYQLDWMANHGYSVEDLAAAVLAHVDSSDGTPDTTAYHEWERDAGFGGEIWACFNEFLDHEYRDEDYMTALLPGSLHGLWKSDIEE